MKEDRMNLVDLIKGYLGNDTVSKIASALGESPDRAKTAISAAVPALLAGLAHTASTPDGARKLNSALDDVDDRTIGNFGNLLSNGATLAERGGSMLNSLLGGGLLGNIGSALSRFTGLGGSSITSLLGMLTPLIMGVLGKQRSSLGLDAAGLGNLLTSQRDNIMNAMPSGLGSLLGNIPGLGSLFGAAGAAASAGRNAAYSAAETVRSAAPSYSNTPVSYATAPAVRRQPVLAWLLPLLALGALGILLLRWMGGPASTTASPPVVTPPRTTTSVMPAPIVSTVSRLSTDLSSFFSKATDALSDIKDSATAEAAIPKIRDLDSTLDSLKTTYTNLTTTDQSTIASIVSPLRSKLQTVIDRVMAMPGVAEKLHPVIDPLVDKLNAFGS
jgi:hypothetical protein